MSARRVLTSFAVVVGTLAVLGTAASEAVAGSSLKILRSWPPVIEAVRNIERYHEQVEKAAAGELKLSQVGPEVVPPFEQLNPVSAGVFDFLFSHGAYHSGSNGLLIGVDALKLDPKKLRESGLFEYISNNYEKRHGLKLLALTPTGQDGYHMVLKSLPDPETGIKGRKIRGTSTYHPLIKKLGGSPVVLSFGQIFTALEKGVVDGYCWPVYGLLATKFYEAGAKYVMRPTLGVSRSFTLVNANAFNKLPKKLQTILVEEGKKVEYWSIKFFDDFIAKEEKQLKALGVTYHDYPEKFRPHVRKWFNEGVLDLVVKYSKADGQKFVDMARAANMVAE
ncbi:MAG: TRAP transporter substrate-binding protein DctP [Defluviicoccus sp.]|nr:TRAP transporter substrate-binding protein DctP [Defluviicoccus sp.]